MFEVAKKSPGVSICDVHPRTYSQIELNIAVERAVSHYKSVNKYLEEVIKQLERDK